MLAFDREAFYALIAQYNATIWPVTTVGLLLGVAILLAFGTKSMFRDRLIGAILALFWLWNGIAFHWLAFSSINFTAPAIAVLFILQALLFVWLSLARNAVYFEYQSRPAVAAGLIIAGASVALYPLLGLVTGLALGGLRVGTTPGPTALFTVGLLIAANGPARLYLLVIPLLWVVVTVVAAWFLDMPEYIAAIGLTLAVGLMVARRVSWIRSKRK